MRIEFSATRFTFKMTFFLGSSYQLRHQFYLRLFNNEQRNNQNLESCNRILRSILAIKQKLWAGKPRNVLNTVCLVSYDLLKTNSMTR